MTVQAGLRSIGYEPGEFEGFTHASESTKGLIKFDWNLNDKNRLAFVYNFLDASKDKPAHPTDLEGQVLKFYNLKILDIKSIINFNLIC